MRLKLFMMMLVVALITLMSLLLPGDSPPTTANVTQTYHDNTGLEKFLNKTEKTSNDRGAFGRQRYG
jgi:hypothetical protein